MTNNLLNIDNYIKSREVVLERLADLGDCENKKLIEEFKTRVRGCNGIGEVDEMYVNYYPVMFKNACCFVTSNYLMRNYREYPRKYFEEILNDFVLEVKRTYIDTFDDVANISYKYNDLLEERKVVVDYYYSLMKLVSNYENANFSGICCEDILSCCNGRSAKILYDSLKESIENRIDYYKRVKAKISGFVLEFKRNSFYSYTNPFIKDLVVPLYSYYDPFDKDLRKLDSELTSLRDEINERMQKDVRKAFKKKNSLRAKFQSDFENEVFFGDGLSDINIKIDKIKTYGGFADFDNRVISLEMARVLNSTEEHLSRFKKNFRGREDGKALRKLVEQALSLFEQISQILESSKDYNHIKINDEKVVSYREISKMLNELKNIDFYEEDLEKISSKLNNVNNYLVVTRMLSV